VPIVDEYLETTVPGIFCAGDVSGVEEASSAMVEGRIAGIRAAAGLGHGKDKADALLKEALEELDQLRAGPMGKHIRQGFEIMRSRL
jgi:sarcosine oxidase subunit alpha